MNWKAHRRFQKGLMQVVRTASSSYVGLVIKVALPEGASKPEPCVHACTFPYACEGDARAALTDAVARAGLDAHGGWSEDAHELAREAAECVDGLARGSARSSRLAARVPIALPTIGKGHRVILQVLRTVQRGQVSRVARGAFVVRSRRASSQRLSYGDLAAKAGLPRAARAAGTAMRRNPMPLLVPCHRVVPANARAAAVGNYSGPGGVATKLRLLRLEADSCSSE